MTTPKRETTVLMFLKDKRLIARSTRRSFPRPPGTMAHLAESVARICVATYNTAGLPPDLIPVIGDVPP